MNTMQIISQVFQYVLFIGGIIGLIYTIYDIRTRGVGMRSLLHHKFQWFSALVLSITFFIIPVNKIHLLWLYPIMFALSYTAVGEALAGFLVLSPLMTLFFPRISKGQFDILGPTNKSNQLPKMHSVDFSEVKLSEEKIRALMETYQVRFQPSVEFKKVKQFFKSIVIEEKSDYGDYKSTIYNNTKLFFRTTNTSKKNNNEGKPTGEFIETISLGGVPPNLRAMMNPLDEMALPKPSNFERANLFELVSLIAMETNCTIYRDDLGFDTIIFEPKELLKFMR